jgi:xylulokinase
LESIAYEYAYYLSILREAVPNLELTEARVIGGGARSERWNQIKADILGLPYQRLLRSEFGTWGSAMIAGKAAGIFDDLAQVAIAHAGSAGESIRPDSFRQGIYAPMIEKYIALQAGLRDMFVA